MVCMGCGKVRGVKLPKGKNKFNASTTWYNGYWYDSILESNYAMFLDFRLKAKEIKSWDRQFPIIIEFEGTTILTHKVDFRTENLDKSFSLIECKGYPTPEWKIKKKLLMVMWLPKHPEYTYEVVTENQVNFARA